MKVGWLYCIGKRGARWVTGKVYKPEKSEEEVTQLIGVGSPEKAETQQGDSSRSESCLEY